MILFQVYFYDMFWFERCDSCDEWSNLLTDFGQKMKESGMIDVAIGTAGCTPDKGLCEGILWAKVIDVACRWKTMIDY